MYCLLEFLAKYPEKIADINKLILKPVGPMAYNYEGFLLKSIIKLIQSV